MPVISGVRTELSAAAQQFLMADMEVGDITWTQSLSLVAQIGLHRLNF